MKSFKEAKAFIDSLPWPAGMRYDLSADLMVFRIYENNVQELTYADLTNLQQIKDQVERTMFYLRVHNPACYLEIANA